MELNGAVTGVGSLPFRDAASALAFVREVAPEVPWWPQLPQRDAREGMLASGAAALAQVDGVEITPTAIRLRGPLERVVSALGATPADGGASAASTFAAFLTSPWPAARAVKGQLTGPLTLCACMVIVDGNGDGDGDGARALTATERADLLEALVSHTAQRAARQAQQLTALGPAIVVADEPMLTTPIRSWRASGALDALQPVLEAIRRAGALAGVHCCDALPLDLLTSPARPDLISFDVDCGTTLEAVCADARMQQFVRDGGMVAWGIVPTTLPVDLDVMRVATRWLGAVRPLDDPAAVAARSLFTAACGFGLVDETATRGAFTACSAVSEAIRASLVS